MIKIFRKIRQSLLNEGKTTKYFKYAIGEIVLVVIGILIALGINSRYNASQNEKKIKVILTQVQEDLMTDILDAQRIFNVYIHKDSIFQKIMNDSITFEMYKENPYPLPITNNYVSFSIKKGGYNRLMENLENLPEKYNCLLPHLNNLYVEMQNDIDDYNTFVKNTVMIEGREDLKINPKLTDYSAGKHIEERMAYYFKDPFLKNKSSNYMNDLGNISLAANDFRLEALVLYKKIDSLLERTPDEYVEPLALMPSKEVIQPFLGDYAGTANALGVNGSLSIENDRLVLIGSDNNVQEIFWHQDGYYFVKGASVIYKLYINNQGQHTLELSFGYVSYKFIKTENR